MKEIRLSKLIKDEDSVATLLMMYKGLRGKENLEKRLFLKTLIWASLNPNSKETGFHYLPPSQFFTTTFTMKEFNRYFDYQSLGIATKFDLVGVMHVSKTDPTSERFFS